MRRLLPPAVALLALSACVAGGPGREVSLDRTLALEVRNPAPFARPRANIALPIADLAAAAADFNPYCVTLYDDQTELPHQVDDMDLDGTPDVLAFQAGLPAAGAKTLKLFYNAGRSVSVRHPKGAHAGVFPEMEGPAWESEAVGYRLYLDGRNAIDVFGKSEAGLALEKYAFGGGSYHDVQPWGVDVLHVGDTLGCGSFGFWSDHAIVKPVETTRTKDAKALRRYAQIVADGPARAIVRVTYDNWPVDGALRTVRATTTIWGGRRWATCDLDVGPGWRPTVAAGVVAMAGAPMVRREEFFYTFGDQTDPMSDTKKPETLGLGILYGPEHFAACVEEAPTAGAVVESDRSRVVLLTPDANGRVRWAYLAAWGRGPLGIRDAAGFESLCASALAELRATPEIAITPP